MYKALLGKEAEQPGVRRAVLEKARAGVNEHNTEITNIRVNQTKQTSVCLNNNNKSYKQ